MSGEMKGYLVITLIGLCFMYGLGVWVGQRMVCPPPPEVEVCRLMLPPVLEDPQQSVPIGRNPE